MIVLITGGLGFIGINFIKYMMRYHKEYELINLDKLTYASNLEKSPCRLIYGDINEIERLIDFKVDFIINFAAETHVDRSIRDPTDFYWSNILGVGALLEFARKNDVTKFIQISTDEVYGSILEGSHKESDKLSPNNPYSASKAAAEMLVRAYHKTYGLNANITRSSNNYGPFQNEEKFIPTIITRALKDEKIPIYGSGLNVRDWLYVEDNCEAIYDVFFRGGKNETYNIGAGAELTNLEVVRAILYRLNKPETLLNFVPDRLGHDIRYSLNTDKIRRLGWKPRYSFYQRIMETIKWYEEFL